VDTGAHYSHRIGDVPVTATVISEFEDWSLLWDTIRSTLWDDPLEISGLNLSVRLGKLPPKAGLALAWMGTGWIVGADLLRQFRVTMDFPRGRLGFFPMALHTCSLANLVFFSLMLAKA